MGVVETTRGGKRSMLSRVANSIYWMTRYVERAENIARIVDVNHSLNLDIPITVNQQWEPLARIMADTELFNKRYNEYNEENMFHFLAFDEEYHNSIISCIRSARENARSIREIISSDMWEQINTLYLFVDDIIKNRAEIESPYNFFRRVRMSCQLFFALLDATMSHGEGWNFGQLGIHLERADKTSRVLDIKYFTLLPSVADVGSPLDNSQWSALLSSVSALEMYRKQARLIDNKKVAEFLILNLEFPRSIRYCLGQAESALHSISGTPDEAYANPAEKLLGRLRSELDYKSIDEINDSGLHEYLDHLQVELNTIGDTIHDTFFAANPISPEYS